MINQFGLRPTPVDDRDIRFGALFDLPKLTELPKEYYLLPRKIKDQGQTDFCYAFASTTVSEFQEGIELSPEYQVAKCSELKGEYESWGCDLRTACKSLCNYGSLPKDKSPFDVSRDSRNQIADWLNWSPLLNFDAAEHAKATYLKVTGPYDVFDNIRATIWLDKNENRAVLTGVLWRNSWTYSPILPETYEADGFGHAFVILGWKDIDGKPYLVCQLSNGNIGDNGLFYMSREIANKELTYGSYTFKDLDPEKAQYYHENGIKISDNWIATFIKILLNLFK